MRRDFLVGGVIVGLLRSARPLSGALAEGKATTAVKKTPGSTAAPTSGSLLRFLKPAATPTPAATAAAAATPATLTAGPEPTDKTPVATKPVHPFFLGKSGGQPKRQTVDPTPEDAGQRRVPDGQEEEQGFEPEVVVVEDELEIEIVPMGETGPLGKSRPVFPSPAALSLPMSRSMRAARSVPSAWGRCF